MHILLVEDDARLVRMVRRMLELELDLITHAVTRDGWQIELSPREFALLQLFIRNPGIVLDRNRILEAVWKLLHTVRGAGYVLKT